MNNKPRAFEEWLRSERPILHRTHLVNKVDAAWCAEMNDAWNAATEATRAECNERLKAMQAEIDRRDGDIKRLLEISDMKSAIIDGMRRVLAVSRMINNQRPDIRMTHALNDYDKCKLKN